MTNEERNLATAEALYAASGSGDWAKCESMLSDNLVITEAPTLPFSGSYRGRTALQELYQKVLPMVGGATINVKGKTAGGDYVIYVLELCVPGKPAIELLELFRFDADGKVAEIRPYYFNSDAVNAAVKQPVGGR